ncbi:hypothetical protein OIU78_024914 [Salix suchowensis]|nr:hypothetical protein OIU78_024914 [Salix suchowensis]
MSGIHMLGVLLNGTSHFSEKVSDFLHFLKPFLNFSLNSETFTLDVLKNQSMV